MFLGSRLMGSDLRIWSRSWADRATRRLSDYGEHRHGRLRRDRRAELRSTAHQATRSVVSYDLRILINWLLLNLLLNPRFQPTIRMSLTTSR